MVCGAVFWVFSFAGVLDLSVLKMEQNNFDSDIDTQPDHDPLTSCKLINPGKDKTKAKLLWLPYFLILLIHFWNIFLPKISHLLCDAMSRQCLIDKLTLCALYTTDMIILSKVSS